MNASIIKGSWNVRKGEIKQKYAAFTNNARLLNEGIKDVIQGRLQIEHGVVKRALTKIFSAYYTYDEGRYDII